jgi:hypothetical protein
MRYHERRTVVAAFALIYCGMAMMVIRAGLSLAPESVRLVHPHAARIVGTLFNLFTGLTVFAAVGLNFYLVLQALARIGHENHDIRGEVNTNTATIVAILESMRARYGDVPIHPIEPTAREG